jgi:hypothetical protein
MVLDRWFCFHIFYQFCVFVLTYMDVINYNAKA